MAEHIILFAGPMGAGKSTAIRALSEIEVVSTEAANNDRAQADKETTTVALDYGEMTLGEEDKIRLYGLPGQKRFDFMWEILRERAVGLVLLIKGDGKDPLADTRDFLAEFAAMHARGGIVIGVTRSDLGEGPPLAEYSEVVRDILDDALIPVFSVDARSGEHMRTCLISLIANVEARAALQSSPQEFAS